MKSHGLGVALKDNRVEQPEDHIQTDEGNLVCCTILVFTSKCNQSENMTLINPFNHFFVEEMFWYANQK